MAEPTPFWLVWSPQGQPPICRHGSRTKARAEAERLAVANPGREFYVLRPVERHAAQTVVRTIYAQVGDDVPF